MENSKKMSSRELTIFILKIVVAVATAVLGVLGASALSSCTVTHSVDAQGKAVIITTDTTVINHNGVVSFPKR